MTLFRSSFLLTLLLLIFLPREVSRAYANDPTTYFGTIALTNWQFPDSTPMGGAYTETSANQQLSNILSAGLFGYDPELAYFPNLAVAVPTEANGGIAAEDGNEMLTIQRKPNLRWSDGSLITNADYVLGLILDQTPEVHATFGIDQIQTLSFSENNLIITYKGFYAAALAYGLPHPLPLQYLERKYGIDLLAELTDKYDAQTLKAYLQSPSYQGSDLQRFAQSWLRDHYTDPQDVFAGPYRITIWLPGQNIILTPNRYYTAQPAPAGHPRPARIQFTSLSNTSALLASQMQTADAYQNIDVAAGFDLADLTTVQHTNYRVQAQNAASAVQLILNMASRPLRDIRVRQALIDAIDKQAYLQALFPSLSTAKLDEINLTSPIPSASPWSNNEALPKSTYAPAKAKALLTAAGYATSIGSPIDKRLTLTLYTTLDPTAHRSAQLLQQFWSQIGVTIQIHYTPSSGPNGLTSSYSDGGVLARRHFDLAQIRLPSLPDPDGFISFFDPTEIPNETDTIGMNVGGVQDTQIMNYLQAGRVAADTGIRARIYDDFQTYLSRQAYWIMLYNEQNIVLVKNTIGNFQPNPQENDWNAWQWWDKKLP